MTIKPVGYVEPVPPGKRTGRNEQVEGNHKADSIDVSTKAMEQSERYQVLELIKTAPELDEARIAELREKINDPAYINDRVINATAENILNAWA